MQQATPMEQNKEQSKMGAGKEIVANKSLKQSKLTRYYYVQKVYPKNGLIDNRTEPTGITPERKFNIVWSSLRKDDKRWLMYGGKDVRLSLIHI